MDWNVILTVKPDPRGAYGLLGALRRFGQFSRTSFRDVCVGSVADIDGLLDGIRSAREAGKPWALRVARVIPAETMFSFTPEIFADRLKEAVTPLVARLTDGSFCVRLERRGLIGKLMSQEIERTVGEHVHSLATAQGKQIRTEFDNPDFVIAIETLGQQCGVALLVRALRERYPFVQVH